LGKSGCGKEQSRTRDAATPLDVRTVVVLDEQPLWVAALAAELERANLAVAAALAPQAGLELIRKLRPDVLVLALEMPNAALDGAEFIRRARAASPATKIVALSIHGTSIYERAARAAGADAFAAKTASGEEIVAVIKAPPAPAGEERHVNGNDLPELTPRELEILELVARGYTNAGIAERLWVSEWTVKFHLANTFRKLGVSNRTQAARYVLDRAALPSLRLEQPA
jgi:DNA-binding NarL/FixJ family response regulator